METLSRHYLLAQRVSHFMLGFAKAQSLEAELADALTPQTEQHSTLCLLWGAIRGHVGTNGGDDSVALDIAYMMLADLPDGVSSFRWLCEHRNEADCNTWATLCVDAVEEAISANDPMPALMDLAHVYRVEMAQPAMKAKESMAMPGSRLLADYAHLFRLEEWDMQPHRLH